MAPVDGAVSAVVPTDAADSAALLDAPLPSADGQTSVQDMRPNDLAFDGAAPAQLLAASADGMGDVLSNMPRPGYLDIKSTAVHLIDRSLRFEMELYQSVPETPPRNLFFGWFVDTDGNNMTGQKYNDIGSDFNVQLDYVAARGWVGLVYNILAGGAATFTTFSMAGPKVTLTIPLSAIGNPERFRYISIDQLDDSLGYGDIVPNQGNVSAALPRVSSAWISGEQRIPARAPSP